MASKAQMRATDKYRKNNVRTFNLKFYPSDADILEHFEKQESKAAYIRELIRKDMEGGN